MAPVGSRVSVRGIPTDCKRNLIEWSGILVSAGRAGDGWLGYSITILAAASRRHYTFVYRDENSATYNVRAL